MRTKTYLIIATIALLLSSCSSSSSSESSPEEAYTQPPKPICKDVLDAKKIDRNPEAFEGKCGVLYLKIIDAQAPEDCQVRTNYDVRRFEFGDFESYMDFYNCDDALDFYTDDSYKVTALVNGSYTFETVLGATRTLASFTIIDVLQ
jgi:hypothetical protein